MDHLWDLFVPGDPISDQIIVQTEKKGLRASIDEILVPSEDVIEMKRGKKINSERKFFPGYMLMKMKMDDEIWHIVRTLPKVYGFLGGKKGEPIPVSQAEIDTISKDLSQSMGSTIKFEYKKDEDLIGGLKIQLGSIMIDTSVKNKLKKYEQLMIED